MWNQPPPDETNIWTWHQQQTYRYEKTPPKVFISAAIETTWKSRLCFFFKCLGRRSDRRYILYIRWVRFWLFCHLDDWSYHFLKPLEVKNITHELQRPLEGKIGRCIIFGCFGLLFGDLDFTFNVLPAHFQESSDSLEDISSLKLLDVQMQYWFTWEIPKVSLSRQQKTWRNTSQEKPKWHGPRFEMALKPVGFQGPKYRPARPVWFVSFLYMYYVPTVASVAYEAQNPVWPLDCVIVAFKNKICKHNHSYKIQL